MAALPQQWPVLGAEERKLLLAALNSNKNPPKVGSPQQSSPEANGALNNAVNPSALNPSLLSSSANLDFDGAALADFGNSGNGFDLGFDDSLNDFSELSPNEADGENGEIGEKRKMSEDDEEEEHGDLKRRDSDDKQAKKPGRKPLTSEPTTKRKAQNRAAQRAFRERKEKHLKDLEQKVMDLEKASESANHENGLLRAQVERLSEELKAYRRRVSLEAGPSPPRTSLSSQSTFDFDFPRFGSLPEAWFPNNSKSASNGTSPAGTTNQGISPRSADSLLDGGSNASPGSLQTGGLADPIDNLFPNGFFNSAQRNDSGQTYSTSNSSASPDAIFDFAPLNNPAGNNQSQSRSMSHTNTSKSNSPSVSSMSHKGPSSSCCTSPESSTQSPNMQKDKEPQPQDVYRVGFISEKNPSAEPASADFNFDWLSSQNGGQFDPVLFGDYREPQAAVVGEGDFTSGLFEDSLPFPDFNDPFNFNMSTTNTVPAPVQTKPSLMDQVNASREGNDTEDAQNLKERCGKGFDMPGDQKAMMTAHKIWNQLQNCPRFVSGDFDIDSLCTELSQKAKCTETGIAVPKSDVEAALWRLVGNNDGSKPKLRPVPDTDEQILKK